MPLWLIIVLVVFFFVASLLAVGLCMISGQADEALGYKAREGETDEERRRRCAAIRDCEVEEFCDHGYP